MNYDNETKQLIEDLDKQAKAIQTKIDELKCGISNENKRWRASNKNIYWHLNSGEVCNRKDYGTRLEIFDYVSGNYFKTEEEAEKYRKNLLITQKLKDIALRLNNGVSIDWGNYSQNKYSIFYRITDNVLELSNVDVVAHRAGCIYCLSNEFLQTAINEIGKQELIEYIKEN